MEKTILLSLLLFWATPALCMESMSLKSQSQYDLKQQDARYREKQEMAKSVVKTLYAHLFHGPSTIVKNYLITDPNITIPISITQPKLFRFSIPVYHRATNSIIMKLLYCGQDQDSNFPQKATKYMALDLDTPQNGLTETTSDQSWPLVIECAGDVAQSKLQCQLAIVDYDTTSRCGNKLEGGIVQETQDPYTRLLSLAFAHQREQHVQPQVQ